MTVHFLDVGHQFVCESRFSTQMKTLLFSQNIYASILISVRANFYVFTKSISPPRVSSPAPCLLSSPLSKAWFHSVLWTRLWLCDSCSPLLSANTEAFQLPQDKAALKGILWTAEKGRQLMARMRSARWYKSSLMNQKCAILARLKTISVYQLTEHKVQYSTGFFLPENSLVFFYCTPH